MIPSVILRNIFTLILLLNFSVSLALEGDLDDVQIDLGLPRFLRQYGNNPMNFDDPDCNRTTLEIIYNKGYFGEQHQTVTKDGYILGLHRIPAPRRHRKDRRSKRPAVILQHGLEGCSFNWVANLPNQSLGFILADAGFDVWLSNSRGNMYSTMHKHLSIRDPKFWRFSFDHMARYDLPAVVDYVLDETGQNQVYYVGHSQGTLIGFVQFSSDLEFAKKIKAFFALAPVARVGHINLGVNELAPYVNEIHTFLKQVGYYQFLPHDGILHKIQRYLCSNKTKHHEHCENLFFAYYDTGVDRLNQTRIPVYMAHCPAGTSTQNMAHFGQLINSDQCQMFDYSVNGSGFLNQIHYGQKTPPIYDVSKLDVPTILFHSDIDLKADPIDVAWLLSQINKTVVENYHYTDYTHTDFILAMDASNDVYKHIVRYIYKQEIQSFFRYSNDFWPV